MSKVLDFWMASCLSADLEEDLSSDEVKAIMARFCSFTQEELEASYQKLRADSLFALYKGMKYTGPSCYTMIFAYLDTFGVKIREPEKDLKAFQKLCFHLIPSRLCSEATRMFKEKHMDYCLEAQLL